MEVRKFDRWNILFLLVVVAVSALLLMTACGAPQQQPAEQATTPPKAEVAATEVEAAPTTAPEPEEKQVTVVWWRSHGGKTGELFDKFAADFTALDNGITIEVEYQGNYIDHLNKLIAAAAANELPDMIHLGDGQYTPLALNGVLMPLNDLIDGPNGLDLDTFKKPIYRGVQDGKFYQLAYGVSTPIFYTNKEALEAAGLEGAPDTWDEFFDVYLPKLAEANPDMVPFAYAPGSWWQQSPVWSAGVMVDDIDSFEVDFANPAAVDWFAKMQKARQDGLVYVPTKADGGAKAYFGSGLAAMTIESTGLIGSVDDISEGKFTAETGFLPSGPGGRWVPSGGNGLSIISGKSPEVVDAAWQFIKYMQAPEQWGAYDKLTGYIPIQKDVEEAIASTIQADPRRQVAIDQFEFSRWHMRAHYSSARADQSIKDAWNESVETDVDVQERLQRLQTDICQILREEGFEPACVGE
jgi:sn-glycerol 3-phosphate transport system substrate-binding protein